MIGINTEDSEREIKKGAKSPFLNQTINHRGLVFKQ